MSAFEHFDSIASVYKSRIKRSTRAMKIISFSPTRTKQWRKSIAGKMLKAETTIADKGTITSWRKWKENNGWTMKIVETQQKNKNSCRNTMKYSSNRNRRIINTLVKFNLFRWINIGGLYFLFLKKKGKNKNKIFT